MPSLSDQILAWCNDRDAEHHTTGCPGGPGCIHAAVQAIRSALRECQRLTEHGDAQISHIAERIREEIGRELDVLDGPLTQFVGLPIDDAGRAS